MNMIYHRKSKISLLMGLLFCLPFVAGCKKNDLGEGVMKLSQLPDHSEYAALPLIGTTWQLAGFVNAKRKTIKLAEPLGKETYLLVFESDGQLNGFTSTNKAGGHYELSSSDNIKISNFGSVTLINELFDGKRYIEAMKAVSFYRISPKGLSLFYAKDSYLLFQPLIPQNTEK